VVVLRNGTFGVLKLVFQGNQPFSFIKVGETFPIGDDCAFGGHRGFIPILSTKRHSAVIVNRTGIVASFPVFTTVSAVDCSRDTLVFCPDECSIALISPVTPMRVIAHTMSPISKMILAPSYKIVIASTIDGDVHILDFPSGRSVRKIGIGVEPALLSVSPKFGCVLALAGHSLSVMNINGVVLLQKEIEQKWTHWRPFSPTTDIDYVLALTDRGRVGFFAPLAPDAVSWFSELKEPIVGMDFDSTFGAFVFVCQAGRVIIFPHPPIM
jgi:hypothetical protein